MPQRKKHHIGLWITLIVVFLVIVLPVALLYGFLYDSKRTSFIGQDDVDTSSLYKDLAYDGFDDTKDSGKVSFSITQDDLNEVFYLAHKKLDASISQYVTAFYVDITDTSYVFYADATVPLFKTRAVLTTSITDDADLNAFVFTITDVKLGRLGGLKSLVLGQVSQYLSDDSLESVMKGVGLTMDADLANGKITYTKANLVNDLKTLVVGASGTDLLSTALDEFYSRDLFSFSFNEGKKVKAEIDLSSLSANDSLSSDKSAILSYTAMDNASANLGLLLDNNVLTAESETNLAYVYDYLLRGYDEASDDAKTYVDSLGSFSSISISDKTTYTGEDLSGVALADILKLNGTAPEGASRAAEVAAKIALASSGTTVNAGYVSEANLDSLLKPSSFIGYTYLLTKATTVDGVTTHGVNFITVDNCYSNLYRTSSGVNKMDVVLSISFNGYETCIVVSTHLGTCEQYSISFGIDAIYFGEQASSEELKTFFFELFKEDWLQYDAESSTLTFDFSSSVPTAVSTAISAKAGASVVYDISGEGIAADGQLNLGVKVD